MLFDILSLSLEVLSDPYNAFALGVAVTGSITIFLYLLDSWFRRRFEGKGKHHPKARKEVVPTPEEEVIPVPSPPATRTGKHRRQPAMALV